MDFDSKEIIESFALEVSEHVQYANECILMIEEQRDEEAVNGLFRALHTIKGNALMLGFDHLGALAHAAEGLVSKLRTQALLPTKQIVDLLFSVLDLLETMTKTAIAEQPEPAGVDQMIQILDSISNGTVSPQNVRSVTTISSPVVDTLLTPERSAPVAAVPETRAEAAELPPASAMLSTAAASPCVDARPYSMLIVEDEFISRKMLTNLLQQYGSCDIATDGVEALAAFSQSLSETPYDFVFLDIMMPNMDGFEAARQMRTLEMHTAMQQLKNASGSKTAYNKHDTIIVMISSLDDPDHYFNACYRCGANTYIVKPVNKAAIDELMMRYASQLNQDS